MAKPNWKINTIAPMHDYTNKMCNKKGKIHQGLCDVNNNHDDLLWFTSEEDLKYICKALNFYETYKPLLNDLKLDLKEILAHIDIDENEEVRQ